MAISSERARTICVGGSSKQSEHVWKHDTKQSVHDTVWESRAWKLFCLVPFLLLRKLSC